jgi:hypothetical protein
VDHYMTLKNYVHLLTKQFSGSICEHSPPSQALASGSTICNLMVRRWKVIRFVNED